MPGFNEKYVEKIKRLVAEAIDLGLIQVSDKQTSDTYKLTYNNMRDTNTDISSEYREVFDLRWFVQKSNYRLAIDGCIYYNGLLYVAPPVLVQYLESVSNELIIVYKLET